MHPRTKSFPLLALGAATMLAAGCGGSGTSASTTPTTAASGQVLPVATNPITGTPAPGLKITKALVENNVSAATGKAADDHLEVALKNTGSKPLSGVAIYYKITDPAKKVSEGYYTKLSGFVIQPGATRIAHFDSTGAPDHYPVNKYSLYYTDKNRLVVEVTAKAVGAGPTMFTVKKDAGGAEAGVE